MVDIWNVPESMVSADVVTARAAEALQYAFVLLQQKQTGRLFIRKNLLIDMGISKDTLRAYVSPVLDDNYKMVAGPTKISVFHGIMHELGVRPSQVYEAAETSRSYGELIRKISRIVLGDAQAVSAENDVSLVYETSSLGPSR